VVYEYPENLEEAISRMGELAHQPSLADSVESVRERLAHPEGFIPASSVPVVGEPSGPPEAIFADLQKTRKKYDDVRRPLEKKWAFSIHCRLSNTRSVLRQSEICSMLR
jgi:hypothetical protein